MKVTKQDSNYAVITGILVSKDRNANYDELKRPVLDIEVICNHTGDPTFEIFPVIVCDVMLAKTIAGYQIGDILTVQGTVRNDVEGKAYIEAEDLAKNMRIGTGESFPVEYMISRSSLMQTTPRFNLVIVVGKVVTITSKNQKSLAEIVIDREGYSKGNLLQTDTIHIDISEIKEKVQCGDEVLCMGEVGGDANHPVIYPQSIRTLSREQNKAV